MTLSTDLRKLTAELGALEETQTGGMSAAELSAAFGDGRFPEFCRDILDFELTPQQLEMWEAIQTENASQAQIMGGNGLGKDRFAVALAIYEAAVMDALAILTGPTDRQVREILMRREAGGLLRAARGKLRFERYTMAIRFPGHAHGTVLAFTASDPDKATGHHSPRIFVGMTECQGVPEEIWQAFQKIRVGPGLFLAVGNPNKASGPDYNASRSPTWLTRFWSALDFPNVVQRREVFPGGATWEWTQQMLREYGESSPFYTSAVLGQYPLAGSADALLRRDKVMEAFARHDAGVQLHYTPAPVLALDVARSLDRDQSVAAVAQGSTIHALHIWRSRDLTETAARFLAVADQTRMDWFVEARGNKVDPSSPVLRDPAKRRQWLDTIGIPALVMAIDAPGIGGGVIDVLRRDGERVTEWWGWVDARDSDRFANLRAAAYWLLRELLESGDAVLPRDPLLEEELLAVEWSTDARGRIIMAPKDEIRKLLGRSPDRLDAVVMALATAAGEPRGPSIKIIRDIGI